MICAVRVRPLYVGVIAALVFLTAQCSLAQNATGSLLGEVQDASGARVKSAVVSVTSNTSGVTRKITTGSTRAELVREQLEDAFGHRGVPEEMLMDHGTPWWNTQSPGGITRRSG